MSRRDELLAAMGLDASDLEANSQGRLTDKEAAHVRAWANGTRLVLVIGLALGLAGAMFLVHRAAPAHVRTAGYVAVAAGVVAFFVVIDRLLTGPIARAAKAGKVTSIEGMISRIYVAMSRPGFAVWIDGHRYQSSQSALGRALRRDERIRLYILPGTRAIVAAEPPS